MGSCSRFAAVVGYLLLVIEYIFGLNYSIFNWLAYVFMIHFDRCFAK